MATSADYRWVVLADKLPAGLASYLPPTEIGPGFTPAASGLDPNADGYIKSGVVPTGTTRIVQTYTISGTPYEWHFRRLWRVSGNKLIWGALDYTSVYYPQDRGEIDLPETTTILKILPVGTSLALFSATGTFLLTNAADPNANFRQVDIIQEATIADATYAVELNNIAYFSNATGFYSMTPDGEVALLSNPVFDDAAFKSKALTCDYERQHVVFGTGAAYSTRAKKFFKYDQAFYYQSPMLRQPNGEPFACRAVAFDIQHDPQDATDKTITVRQRFGGREWQESVVLNVPYGREQRDRVFAQFNAVESARTFDIKIGDMSAGLWIRRIYAEVAGFTQRSRED